MNESWLTIFLLALVASFLPLQFGAEVSLLGKENGTKKASSLVGGITLYKVLVAVIVVFLIGGAMAALTQDIQGIGGFIKSTLATLGQDVTSGQHALLDLLLIAAGVALIIHAYRTLRGRSEANQTSEEDTKKVHRGGAVELIMVGLVWMLASPAQWLYTSAGTSQILALPVSSLARAVVFVLFLLLCNLMVILPVAIYLIWPERAGAELLKIDAWINGAFRYVVIAGFFFIGSFFIWKGAGGLLIFLNS
ncbi:MAG: GAP family protein [Chloroflexota bacterium]|nr:GAP family protein [Chloroflexota bacterium]